MKHKAKLLAVATAAAALVGTAGLAGRAHAGDSESDPHYYSDYDLDRDGVLDHREQEMMHYDANHDGILDPRERARWAKHIRDTEARRRAGYDPGYRHDHEDGYGYGYGSDHDFDRRARYGDPYGSGPVADPAYGDPGRPDRPGRLPRVVPRPRARTAAFLRLDVNRDGYLSRAEARRRLTLRAFFRADVNRDGYLSWPEFRRFTR